MTGLVYPSSPFVDREIRPPEWDHQERYKSEDRNEYDSCSHGLADAGRRIHRMGTAPVFRQQLPKPGQQEKCENNRNGGRTGTEKQELLKSRSGPKTCP